MWGRDQQARQSSKSKLGCCQRSQKTCRLASLLATTLQMFGAGEFTSPALPKLATMGSLASIRYYTFEAFFHNVCVLTSIHPISTCTKIIYNGKCINNFMQTGLVQQKDVSPLAHCDAESEKSECLTMVCVCGGGSPMLSAGWNKGFFF